MRARRINYGLTDAICIVPEEIWFAIKSFKPGDTLLEKTNDTTVYPYKFPFVLVDNDDTFAKMMADLDSAQEAAVDVECHTIHSYAGRKTGLINLT